MGVPNKEAPAAVHEYWANVPNYADINFLFRRFRFGPVTRVKCEAWGQLADDHAATNAVFYHIRNKRQMWDAEYLGWEEIGGPRKGDAPKDFLEQYNKFWAAW